MLRTLLILYELPFSVSPLTPKLNNFIKGLEVEQGMGHIVDSCSSAFVSTPIFIILSTMEYGVFQIMNIMYEIVSLYRNCILHSLPHLMPPAHCFLRLECISFFFMLQYFNIIHYSPLPNVIIPHTKSGRCVWWSLISLTLPLLLIL